MADVAKLLETMHPMREPPPPAPILPMLVMIAIGCAVAAVVFVSIWEARRYRAELRRAAEAALAASRALAPAERLAAQATMLRRLARGLDGTGAGRAQGKAWLERLDTIFVTRFFTEGDGAAYGDALYRPQPGVDVDALDRSIAGFLAKVRA